MHDYASCTLICAAAATRSAVRLAAAPWPGTAHGTREQIMYISMLTTILFWVVFGALAGWIASALTGADRRVAGWMNVVVGVLGAAIGGLIFRAFGGSGVTGFNLYSLLVAVIGAIVFLWIMNAVNGRMSTPR